MDFKIQNLWKKKEEEDPEDVAENARLEKDMELEKKVPKRVLLDDDDEI